MYAESIAFFGILTLILFVFAELGRHKIMGAFAALLLILMGLWVGLDNITFQTGSYTATTITTTNTTITTNATLTPTYSTIAIPNTPVAFNILLATLFIFVGIYAMLYYALYVVR